MIDGEIRSRWDSACLWPESDGPTSKGDRGFAEVARYRFEPLPCIKKLTTLAVLLFALAFSSLPVRAQQLAFQSDSGKQKVLSRADLEALPHVKVTTAEHSGNPVTFEGVSLRSVLEKAGVTLGESLKSKRLAACLVVEGADSYRVVIALPELDPAFTDKQFLLAFLRDGKPLDAKEGPYRIVIPEEKRMARWVRQVTVLKIVDVP